MGGICEINKLPRYFDPTKPIICNKTIKEHKNKVVYIIILYDEKFATASYDHTIKIWKLNSFKCERTIKEEGSVVCLLEFQPNMILSGNELNRINAWNLNNLNQTSCGKFEGHSLWVNCLAKCDNKFFASCSNDSDIRIWDFFQSKCKSVLKGHTEAVLTLIKLKNGKLCSGSADLTIKIWNWQMNICEGTLEGHTDWVKCLYQLENGYILSGSNDKSIKIWDNEQIIETLYGHNGPIRDFCQISENYFASASFDKTIKIWDLKTRNLIRTLEGHQSNVTGIIYIKSGILISCSNDNTIKIWEVK